VLRRDPASGLAAPVLKALGILSIPTVIIVLSTEIAFMQKALMTQPLTGAQWLVVIALALIGPIVVEVDKWIRRRRVPLPKLVDARAAVEPMRAHAARTSLAATKTGM
jgi:Ca2+-transporting ATPase